MKAVLLSIRPKWVELIASGKKTIEIRKTAPHLKTPFKCYIYCAKETGNSGKSTRFYEHENGPFYSGGKNFKAFLTGAVVGEFVCDRILDIFISSSDPNLIGYPVPRTGLTDREIMDYLGNGKPGYGWHISALKMYDEPKKLSEFRSYNTLIDFEQGYPMPTHGIRRPPQSYMYVEELTT